MDWIIGRVTLILEGTPKTRGRIAMTNLAIEHHDLTVTPAAQTKIRELIHQADDDINSYRAVAAAVWTTA